MAQTSTAARRAQADAPPTTTSPHSEKGIWIDHIEGRFRRITVRQLVMAWWCYHAGHITRRQLRVYFAAHEMAERRRYTDPVMGPERPLYTDDEIARLLGECGDDTRAIRRDVRRLARIGLVNVTDHAIDFAAMPDELTVGCTDRLAPMLARFDHQGRSVPMPRRMLRTLAAGLTRNQTAVVLAMMIRCLYWHKEANRYRVDGRTKRQHIADSFGISLRGVAEGRRHLIDIGWLMPIESTPQWLLNRYGAHDRVNTDWSPRTAANDDAVSARPATRNGVESARPDQTDHSSLREDSNTRRPAPMRAGPTGVSRRNDSRRCVARSGTPKLAPTQPNVRDIRPDDLRDVPRLLQLHRQAIACGLSEDSEAAEVEFVAMAERAGRVAADPAAMFFWLISNRKGAFVTQAEEETACRRLRAHRDGRRRESRHASPRELTREQRFMLKCRRIGELHRQDPSALAQEVAGWSEAEWDSVVRSFETTQAGDG